LAAAVRRLVLFHIDIVEHIQHKQNTEHPVKKEVLIRLRYNVCSSCHVPALRLHENPIPPSGNLSLLFFLAEVIPMTVQSVGSLLDFRIRSVIFSSSEFLDWVFRKETFLKEKLN